MIAYFFDEVPSRYGYNQIVPSVKGQMGRKELGLTTRDFDKCQMNSEHFTNLANVQQFPP